MRYASATIAMALLLPPLEDEPSVPNNVEVVFNTDRGAVFIDEEPDGAGVFLYPMN